QAIHSIRGHARRERGAVAGTDPVRAKLEDAACGELDTEPDLETVLRHGDLPHVDELLVDLRRAVRGMVGVVVLAHRPGGAFAGRALIDGPREAERESVVLESHLEDVEGHLAGPFDALDPFSGPAPKSRDLAEIKRAIGREGQAVRAAAEVAAFEE